MKKNNRGFLTLDFLFAFTIVMSFTFLLFALTFTLSVVEVVQYMTYSAARSFYGGHLTLSDQIRLGETKFSQLKETQTLKPLFKENGWFEIRGGSGIPESVDNQWNELYPNSTRENRTFYGSRVLFISKLLSKHIKLFYIL